MSRLPFAKWMALLALVCTLPACSSIGVKPWQREILARKEMAMNAAGVDGSIDDHIYFSKEATSGGRGFGGGGCGCN